MPIDAGIYAQFAQPRVAFDGGQNMLLKQAQLQEAQQTNQLNAQKLDAYTQQQGRTNQLRSMLSGMPADTNDAQRIQTMRRGGYFDEADKLQTTLDNQRKVSSEADSKDASTGKARLEAIGAASGAVLRNPNASVQDAHDMFDYLGTVGALPANQVQELKARIAANPQNVRKMAETWQSSAIDALKQLPVVGVVNGGDRQVFTNTNPMTGEVTQKGQLAIGQSPDNAATVGATMYNANATRDAARLTQEGAKEGRNQQTEMKLADDYRAQSKDFKAVGDAYRQINSTLDSATKSPAATLAAATKFMKLLDPGSVVRESELGMALAASGVLDRATNYVNVLQSGKVLTPNQVADFKNITEKIYGASIEGQKMVDDSFSNTAKNYGLRPENVLQNMGQNRPQASQGAAPANLQELQRRAVSNPAIAAKLKSMGY